MRKMKLLTLLMCLAMVFSCNTKQGTGASIGAGGGALIGGILGNIGGAIGAGTGAIIGRHMDKVAAETAAQVQNAKVEKVTDANGLSCVKLTFDSGILFQTAKYDLNESSKRELAKFASVLKNHQECSVDIQGYTDSTGSDAINNPLSVNRAQSVAQYLNTCGVPSTQFKNVSGFGSSNPVASNETVEGRQQNRRVEVYLYASEEMIKEANSGRL